jgi:GT2 family glycosyltransferase
LDPTAATIVIATSSRYELLEQLLKSLADQTFKDFRTILVCIKIDGRIEGISSKYDAILLEDERKGRCYARNLGVKKAEGSIVVFLDDDVTLEKDWLELIMNDFRLNPRIGGVGGVPISVENGKASFLPTLYDFIYDLMINKAGGLVGWQGKIGDCPKQVDFLSGSNMAFRRDILLWLGGFDENFYWSSLGEDVDLCLRVTEQGYLVILDPRAKAHHFSDFIQRWSTSHR